MRDEALTTAPGLTAAESTVNYLLKRMRVDANLRYHMLHTEAFAKLCAAEAERTGKTIEAVVSIYSRPADHCRDDEPKLVELRRVAKECADTIYEKMGRSPEWVADVLEKLEMAS